MKLELASSAAYLPGDIGQISVYIQSCSTFPVYVQDLHLGDSRVLVAAAAQNGIFYIYCCLLSVWSLLLLLTLMWSVLVAVTAIGMTKTIEHFPQWVSVLASAKLKHE